MIKHVVPLSTIYTPMKVTRKGVNILVYIVPIKLAIKSLHSYQDVVNVALWASVWSKHKEEGGPPGPPPPLDPSLFITLRAEPSLVFLRKRERFAPF